jgi:hypothetical protein
MIKEVGFHSQLQVEAGGFSPPMGTDAQECLSDLSNHSNLLWEV